MDVLLLGCDREGNWHLVSLCYASDNSHSAPVCRARGRCLLSLPLQWLFHHGGVLLPTLVFTVSGASAVIRIQCAAPGYEVVPQTGHDWRAGPRRCQSHFVMEL